MREGWRLGFRAAARRAWTAIAVAVLMVGAASSPAQGATAAAGATGAVTEEAVAAVASKLRCVVCQNLSVADSPSEMARQMRDLIREQLASGRTPPEVISYFVARYGEWVLLSPPAHGFNLFLWAIPFAGLLGGLGVVLVAAWRWSRRRRPELPPQVLVGPVDRERIRAELERLRE